MATDSVLDPLDNDERRALRDGGFSSALALANAFSRLREEIAGVDTRSTMDAVTAIAVREVPSCSWASITLLRGRSFRTAAATDELAIKADALQYELDSGPCVDAVEDDHVYVVADIARDPRWPRYGPRVHGACGVVSMLSFRLAQDDEETSAALNLYALTANAFDDDDVAVGLLLATHGALAVSAASSRERAENLSLALKSNRDIGIAIGVIMTQHKVTRDQAFDLLRISSQRTHRKLHDLALDVIETGHIALPEQVSSQPRAVPRREGRR